MQRFREAAVIIVALLGSYAAAPPQPLDPAFAHSAQIRSELTRVVAGIGTILTTGAEAEAARTP